MIPFVDLKTQYKSIQAEIDHAIKSVIEETAFIGGKYAKQFEEKFAEYLGINNCIACANGTDSLEILLKAMGVGMNDEVIVPAISWISTSEAVSSTGAKPIFVDVNPDFYTIDISKIEEKITHKTKAIIPVHLYGQPVNMVDLMAIAKKHNLKVLEDCAQAHGAEFNNKKVGTFGDCASFSFYPGKNLGAYGDAGCMVTNDLEIAKVARMIGNHGQEGKHNHIIEGRNSRMDGIQAAILSVKVKYINQWTDGRIDNAAIYNKLLAENESIIRPKVVANGKHVYHLYVIRTKKRDELMNKLKEDKVGVSIHYPTALPFLECYKHLNHTIEDFPIAYKTTQQIISLPMFAELTKNDIESVSEKIKHLLK